MAAKNEIIGGETREQAEARALERVVAENVAVSLWLVNGLYGTAPYREGDEEDEGFVCVVTSEDRMT